MQAHSAKQSFTLQARLRKALHCHSYDGDIDCTDRDSQRAPCQFPACRSSINSAALHRLFWLFRKDADATEHSPLLQSNQTRQAFTKPTRALSRNETTESASAGSACEQSCDFRTHAARTTPLCPTTRWQNHRRQCQESTLCPAFDPYCL